MARPRPLRAHPNDREIWRLAVPAFGALAAEPLYVLADTAIVGRLGTNELGGLGVAGSVLTAVFGIFNFLAYATTAAVARRFGAGDRRAATEHGVAGMWLALGLGIALTVAGLVVSRPVVEAMGASPNVAPHALTYLRISLLGAPLVLCTLAATGFLRGVQDTRTPLLLALVANAINVVLEVVFVFGLDMGIAGSAWGTVIAQATAATVFVVILVRSARTAGAPLRPHRAHLKTAAVIGGHLTVRTGSLLLAFLTATAVAARIGDVQIAAHQIAWQIWYLLALSLDAIAIAGQAIVGRYLGAGDEDGVRASTARMLEWGVLAGVVLAVIVVASAPFLATVFTDDPRVHEQLRTVLWAVALMQPLAAVVFVLDGILIGAGDARYLAVAMATATAVFLPVAGVVVLADGGLLALWGALYVLMFARLAGLAGRYRSEAWLVTGAIAPG